MFDLDKLVRQVADGLDTEAAARILEAAGLEPTDFGGEILEAAATFNLYGPGYGR